MPWPSGSISTANLDAGSDSPAAARPQLLAAVAAVNDIVSMRGAASGVASLDSGGLVPTAQIPSILPSGILVPYAGSSAPSGWLLCDGSAVSRTTYAALFAAISTTYGVGDGSTTFNVPDLRGRIPAGQDNMGGTAAGRLQVSLSGTTTASSAVVTGLSSTTGLAVGMSAFGSTLPGGVTIASIDSATQVTLSSGTGVTAGTATLRFGMMDAQALGAAGGSHIQTLTTPQMPAHTHAQTGQNGGTVSAGAFFVAGNFSTVQGQATGSTGGGQAHPNVQPTVVTTYIIKT